MERVWDICIVLKIHWGLQYHIKLDLRWFQVGFHAFVGVASVQGHFEASLVFAGAVMQGFWGGFASHSHPASREALCCRAGWQGYFRSIMRMISWWAEQGRMDLRAQWRCSYSVLTQMHFHSQWANIISNVSIYYTVLVPSGTLGRWQRHLTY